ncbi:cytochrome c/c1 heme-lyase [Auriculariales sp. MPI-PUGE-AT-0066]|nr:cytochrome c/c1 heme-lyase [Auriculariales sp. MPI-PUGE-AT-0066]
MSCPVKHDEPDTNGASAASCPVKHDEHGAHSAGAASGSSSTPSRLDTSRVTSSIPRTSGGNWEYPSEAQFYAAMERKQQNPHANDMEVVVNIHNAVNERAWMHVLDWEQNRGGDKCGGIKLVTFKGLPSQPSPRARWKTLWGYQAPFDRHDWVVDRCGTKIRYVIDFYTGRSIPGMPASFYIDCRPALDSWEAIKMRTSRFWSRMFGFASNSASVPRPIADRQPKAQ